MKPSHRVRQFTAISLLTLLCIGCGGIAVTMSAKQAKEDRSLTEPHVAGTGLHVDTPNGAIEIVADPELTQVAITAHITAHGESEEDAKAKLADVKVKVSRQDDRTLDITADIPKDATGMRGACSFVVRVPDARGCQARSGSGSITLKGLAGHADVHTANGSISVAEHTGDLAAQSGSGSVTAKKVSAAIDVKTANGTVTISDAGAAVKAHSGSGSVHITRATGVVTAHTDNGSVLVEDAGAGVTANSGSGAVTLNKVKGAAKAKTANGTVTLEQLGGAVDAESGSGSIACQFAPDNTEAFHLHTSNGSLTVRLPKSAAGSVRAGTSNGNVTVNGPRKPMSVSGAKGSKEIKITDQGPASTAKSGSGSITVTLE